MKIGSVIITGGCGFIGTSLIAQLLKINSLMNIRIIDNFSTGTPDDLRQVADFQITIPNKLNYNNKLELIEGDIREMETVLKCTKGMDCIVHLAANTGVDPSVKNPRLDMENNVIGTFNMLESARINSVKKFIFASSGAPAGDVKPPIHEELPPHPVSPYGASKLAGEGYCSAYYRTFGIYSVCLRFGNVYGPRSKKKSSVVAKFIRQAMNGEKCVIYGDGKQTRDFLYIDDLIQAIMISIKKELGGEIFQIATGVEHNLDEIAGYIAEALARRGINMEIDYDLPRNGDVKHNYADTRKAEKILGWKATTDLKKGIEKTINYFLALSDF